MWLDFFATFFADALLLLPIFADKLLLVGPGGYGLLLASHGAGSVIAGLILSMRPLPRRQGLTVLISVAIYGAAYAAFGASKSYLLSLALLGVAGAADTVSAVVRVTLRQMLTPDEMRGRMNGINMVFFVGGPQLGEAEAGLVARWFNPQVSVISGGVACLVLAMLFAFNRPLRQFRESTSTSV
jgi:MFS family permease